ncbi:peptide/nickel transport system substrate-binding protein [Nitratireductor aquibiodomus]|uniref:Peptide/nickel transport system substrate-binding protein n=1 Tax=Nitratireductor aquibiodomus TaxID=204799 RepID=A0A1H4L4R0_9HYPH|nr:ABC transporter substrate-binding protein [Nitratireductor aquibiodomus]SEB65398.1 peptide/nickel transport system substrate-binding protein [Nitratireductor aquibiodomus]
MYKTLAAFAMALGCSIAIPNTTTAQTLTIAQDFDPSDLYGTRSTNNAMFPILESLYLDDPATGKIRPLLALEHEMVSDTELLIKLRKGVSFSNGEPMNAEAVAHSIKLFADPKTVPAYGIYASTVDTAEAVDEHTVRVTLTKPSPIVDLLLAQILVVPPKYWEEVGPKGFGQKPIGTGQFLLTEWSKDDRIVMDLNPDYWGEPPKGFDKLVWKTVPEANARAAGLKTGEYDLAIAIPVIDAIEIENLDGVDIYSGDVSRVFQLTLSSLPQHEGPVQDKRVRQALNYAIDKQAIIDALYYGKAKLLNGQVILPSQPGYDPEMRDYPHDPEKAKALLAEAGYPDGIEIEFRCPSNRYPQGQETCEAISGMLSKVGIKTNITLLESGEFIRQLVNREYAPMGILGLGVPDDPSFGLAVYRSDWRYSYYQNPELDALIDASASTVDPKERAEIIRKASKLIYDEAVIVYLFGGREFYGHSERLKNFATNTAQRYFFYDVVLEPK